MKPKNRIMCPECSKPKMQFETEKEANTFIKFNGQELTDDISKLRVYYCNSCCCYHISSKSFKKSYLTNTEKLIDAYHSDLNIIKTFKEKQEMIITKICWQIYEQYPLCKRCEVNEFFKNHNVEPYIENIVRAKINKQRININNGKGVNF